LLQSILCGEIPYLYKRALCNTLQDASKSLCVSICWHQKQISTLKEYSYLVHTRPYIQQTGRSAYPYNVHISKLPPTTALPQQCPEFSLHHALMKYSLYADRLESNHICWVHWLGMLPCCSIICTIT